MSIQLENYYEKINTECDLQGNPILDLCAYKIDEVGKNSLKYKLCKNDLKSCDYMLVNSSSLFFIEFSDLYEQLSGLKDKENIILSSDIQESNIDILKNSKMILKPKQIIKDELMSKIADTLNLFTLIIKKTNISEDNKEKEQKFYICLCKIVSSDIILFDNILRDIKRKYRTLIDVDMFEYIYLESKIS